MKIKKYTQYVTNKVLVVRDKRGKMRRFIVWHKEHAKYLSNGRIPSELEAVPITIRYKKPHLM